MLEWLLVVVLLCGFAVTAWVALRGGQDSAMALKYESKEMPPLVTLEHKERIGAIEREVFQKAEEVARAAKEKTEILLVEELKLEAQKSNHAATPDETATFKSITQKINEIGRLTEETKG